ncbi:MAG: hypothetical protein ACHQUC_04540, partial [Chlamydiales bacterium]
MFLAFFIDQLQQRCCGLFQAAVKKTGSRARFWRRQQSIFTELYIASWDYMDNDATPQPIMESPLSPENSTASPSLPFWAWCLIGLNAIWIVALFYALFKKMRFKDSQADSLRKVKRQLKGACQANDAKQAERALLAWGALVFPQDKILNIIEIKKYLSENLALFTSSVRISVGREGSDALVFDEGIAPAIWEEKNRADDSLAGDRKLTDEVNKAKNL